MKPPGPPRKSASGKRIKHLTRAQVDLVATRIYRGDALSGKRSGSGGAGGRAHTQSMDFPEFCHACMLLGVDMWGRKGVGQADALLRLMRTHINPLVEQQASKEAQLRRALESRAGGPGVEEARADDPDAVHMLAANREELLALFRFYAAEATSKARAAGKAPTRKGSKVSMRDSLAKAALGTDVTPASESSMRRDSASSLHMSGGAGGASASDLDETMDYGEVLAFCRDFGIVPSVLNMTELLQLYTTIMYTSVGGHNEDDDAVELRDGLDLPRFDLLLARLAMRRVLPGEADASDVRDGMDADTVRSKLAAPDVHMAQFLRMLNASDGFARVRSRSRGGGATLTNFKVLAPKSRASEES